MPVFDLNTLLAIVGVIGVILLLLCTFGLDSDVRSLPLRWWALGLGLWCATVALIAARGLLTPTAAFVSINVLLMLAPLAQLRAIQTSIDTRVSWPLVLFATAGFVAALVWLWIDESSRELRVATIGTYFVLVEALIVHQCLSVWQSQPARPLMWLAVAHGVYALLFAARVGTALASDAVTADPYAPSAFNGTVYVVTLLHMVVSTIAFLLLQMLLLQRRLRDSALRDLLTGLLNRRGLQRPVDAALSLARRAHTPLALAVIDVDHFKRINDRHGHTVGDAVLRQVAEILHRSTRPSDSVARLGGEEFCVLMPGDDGPHAENAAQRLRAALSQEPVTIGPISVPITVSIGVAQWSPGMDSWDDLFAQADEAVYRAKRSGRNRVVLAGQERGGTDSGGREYFSDF
jgi:diguanylate cyclase (GGDEF)-like protein